mmetsp:Transcript_41419/g.64730  ORF Transcript_41419/g.64730 Transcript_41419/m.64730 type:complete len:257 (+) Transcript_41419:454-1224(+)
MALEELCNSHRSRALLSYTETHCLACLQNHEGCKRVDDISVNILDVLHPVVHVFVLANDSTSCHHIVALVKLGQTLDNHVCTMLQRSQHNWCCECCINHMLCTSSMCDFRDLLDVAEGQKGIRWRFAEDKLRVWLHCFLHDLWIPEINKSELHSKRCEELSATPVRATIRAISNNTVIASLHCCTNASCRCGHTCPKCCGAVAHLQHCEFLLQGGNGRVVCAGVAETFLQVILDRILHECSRQKQWRKNSTRLFLW